MFKKSVISLGFLVLCLKMMASNGTSTDRPTIPMTPAELDQFWPKCERRFAANRISREHVSGLKNEKGNSFIVTGENGKMKCEYAWANLGGGISEGFSCGGGSGCFKAATQSASYVYNNDGERTHNGRFKGDESHRMRDQIKKRIAKQLAGDMARGEGRSNDRRYQ